MGTALKKIWAMLGPIQFPKYVRGGSNWFRNLQGKRNIEFPLINYFSTIASFFFFSLGNNLIFIKRQSSDGESTSVVPSLSEEIKMGSRGSR